jgi:thiamine biosynthesis lipoprotein
MGTLYTVKVVDPPRSVEPQDLRAGVEGVLRQVDTRMSTYRQDSELSRLNAARTTEWITASPELVTVLKEALWVSEATGGAFDVTVGPLVNLWGFGPGGGADKVPPEGAIQAALARVGYRRLHVRSSPPAVRKDRPDVYVDLSAIAKGYAVDRVADYLQSRGTENYMVEVGGEIHARGYNARATAWRIAIERPSAKARAVQLIVALDDAGVATSGDYRNYFERDGHRYSHTIDPTTGRPITHALASVTVIAPSTMHADALATGLMVLGPEKGYALAQRLGLAAFIVVKAEDGFRERTTPAFAPYRSGEFHDG